MQPETDPTLVPYAEAMERQKGAPYDGSYLIELPAEAREFVANGTRYRVTGNVGLFRFLLLEQFGVEFTFTGGIPQIFEQVVATREAMQKVNWVDAALANEKILTGIARIDEKQNYALQVCSLFINREGEDLRKWSQELADDKIADWNEAGLDAGFFLIFAARSVPGFIAVYGEHSQQNLQTATTSNSSSPDSL